MTERYRDLNSYLRARFGCRVQKITLDAGLTCPNRDGTKGTGGCIYCNARGSGTGAHARGLAIREQLEAGRAAVARRYGAERFIAYFQSFSNTYAPLARLRALYEEAASAPGVVALFIGTRPDCVTEEVLDLLAEFSRRLLVWVEYGLQTANEKTLAAIRRGHGVEEFLAATAAARARGIPVCAHIILGLPGETREDARRTARFLGRAEVEGVKIHSLYIVRGTALEELYRRGAYRPLSREEYAAWAADVIERLPPGVVIQRLTGDPHPAELVAPAWSLDKAAVLAAIRGELERRDSRQGIFAHAEAD
ncbi:MAG: TIGR01212 family radical SAM protein [Desulfobacterales bacterium]